MYGYVWPDGLMIMATHSRHFRVPFPSVTSQRGDFIAGKPENAEVWEKFVLVPWPVKRHQSITKPNFSAHVFPCTGLWKLFELGEGVGCKFPWNQLQPINGYKRCCKFDKEDHYFPRFDADASG